MKFNKLKRFAVLAAFAAGVAHAGGGPAAGGATEFTQMMNNVELASQTAQQINMVRNQLEGLAMAAKNLTASPQQIWAQGQSDLTKLINLVSQGQSLIYTAQNVDQSFKQKFPGYGNTPSGQTYGTAYKNWSESSRQGISNALQTAGLQAQLFSTELGAIQQIQSISAGSPGALQAIQAGSMIAAQQVDQLQKLRQLQMAQMEAQNTYMAAQQSRQDDVDSSVDAFLKGKGDKPLRKWGESRGGFGSGVR